MHLEMTSFKREMERIKEDGAVVGTLFSDGQTKRTLSGKSEEDKMGEVTSKGR